MALNNITTPIPADFAKSMVALLGSQSEGDALIESLEGESPVSIRINSKKGGESGYDGITPVSWCDGGFYLSERPVFTLNPLLHAGCFYVQEAASMIHSLLARKCVEILGDRPLRVLDLCAAPGGKTTAVINALPNGSVVVANEFSPQRASVLKENLIKYGYPSVCVTNADATRFSESPDIADIVIVDAPCSGEGMMRKEETARSQWSEGLIKSCAALQRSILDAAAVALRPGGILIYSTCTFNRSEDEDNVGYLINNHGLEAVSLRDISFPGLSGGLSGEDDVDGCVIRFFPHRVATEGLFVAMLRKPEGETPTFVTTRKKDNKRHKKGGGGSSSSSTAFISSARQWLQKPEDYDVVSDGEMLRAVPAELEQMVSALPKGVRILMEGVPLARIKGKDIIPCHELALSTSLNPSSFPIVNLNEGEAITYLKREMVTLPETTPKGFVIVAFKGFPLGFVKNLGNRCNNLYPADYRIRMR